MSIKQAEKLADGRAFIGTNALDRKLVDAVETFATALQRLKVEAAMNSPTEAPRPKRSSRGANARRRAKVALMH